MKPIIKNGTRILRPGEVNQLLPSIKKQEHKICFKTLLFTGMRYEECRMLHSNPGWLDGMFIHLPSTKKKATQEARWIRLNPLGQTVVEFYLSLNKGLPSRISWYENLKRWSTIAGIGTEGISNKVTRKTWESWLMFYYPNRVTEITLSQGHTDITQIKHYINLPFCDEDKSLMEHFVQGWI